MNEEKTNDYGKLLKDARWQKKRLEVMQRDNFTCQDCGKGLNDGIVLNVHHIRYRKGLLPWEYKDYELVTLCEDCHSKKHKENTSNVKKEDKTGKSKKTIPFFRNLLFYKGLKPCDMLIVSYLIMLDDFGELNSHKSNDTAIAKALGITRCTVYNSMQRLVEMGICNKHKRVVAENDFRSRGFFELHGKENLKGDLLIFYSYLLDKSKKYDYCIDTFKYRLAEDLGKTKVSITKLLNRLYERGYAERLKDGKLKINFKPPTK